MMGSLLKWESKQTLSSLSFWIIGATMVILPALFLILTLKGSDVTGYEAYLEGLSNFNGFMLFLVGIFAGIHVSGAFESRKIQAAVMAGNSRIKILLAKFFTYLASIGLFTFIGIAVSTAIAFIMQGTGGIDGTFVRMIVARALLFVLVETAFSSICFLTSMYMRHQGSSIGFNLMMMVVLSTAVQLFIANPTAEKIFRFIPAGQSLFVVGDMSNKNILMALASVAIFFVAVPALSFIRFGKEELK
jgi:ABC-type transport system involved in multi-copper enzyme maturation permease subunit